MDAYYLSEIFFNQGFLLGYIFLTMLIWIFLRTGFDYDNFGQAAIIALVGIIFMPSIVAAMSQSGSAFLLILLLLGLAISSSYGWNLSATMLILVLAVYSAAMILPRL